MVRSLLNGRFANTSFCIFDPQGKKRLSRSGRSPGSLVGRRSQAGDESIMKEMDRIAARYKSRNDSGNASLQNFDTFRQALNVASADQRLLVAVTSKNTKTLQNLRAAFSDDKIVGRFHVDQIDSKSDRDWQKVIEGESKKPGILIIQSGQFGLKGKVVKQLPEDASVQQIKDSLLQSNKKFALTEKRKDYRKHVFAGLRQGIYFKNAIPYGEDLDADGVIDRQPRRGRDK